MNRAIFLAETSRSAPAASVVEGRRPAPPPPVSRTPSANKFTPPRASDDRTTLSQVTAACPVFMASIRSVAAHVPGS
jgi:hypothetical protein